MISAENGFWGGDKFEVHLVTVNVGRGGVSHVISNLFIDEFLQKKVVDCISRGRLGDDNVIANIRIEF